MCIVFYTLNHPGYQLILAANRDEYLDRPALPARWHKFELSLPLDSVIGSGEVPPRPPMQAAIEGTTNKKEAEKVKAEEEPWVLCGRDLGNPAAGTWLGMTRDLRIGILTNIRFPIAPPSPNAPSRGLLLKRFLSSSPSSQPASVEQYLLEHHRLIDQYDGLNLLLFHLHPPTGGTNEWAKPDIGYLTNRPVPTITQIATPTRPLVPLPAIEGGEVNQLVIGDVQGLSNSPMLQPWPKVSKGEVKMSEILSEWSAQPNDPNDPDNSETRLIDSLIQDVLAQTKPLDSLKDTMSCTCLHPVFLGADTTKQAAKGEAGRWYGTRVSTVILVKNSGEVTFVERDIFVDDGRGGHEKGRGERKYRFSASCSL